MAYMGCKPPTNWVQWWDELDVYIGMSFLYLMLWTLKTIETRIIMECNHTMNESRAPTEDKGTKPITSESLSDLEADSASSTAARRPGSMWFIVGCVSYKLDVKH